MNNIQTPPEVYNATLIDAALKLAASGLPVFPCQANKKPLDGSHGFKDATTDALAIVMMFDVPEAKLIGVPCGPVSGFDALDFDYGEGKAQKEGAKAWEQANLHRLPETRTHETETGGRHMLFRFDPRVGNSIGKDKPHRPGIDVRGTGGYVVMPPSTGYRIISDADLVPWPEWLLVPGLALPPLKDEAPRPSTAQLPTMPLSAGRLNAYRDKLLDTVTEAPEGGKHETLRNCARSLGGIAAEAGFTDAAAVEWLLAALPNTVADWRTARATAAWGLREGRKQPLAMDERTPDVLDQFKDHIEAPASPVRPDAAARAKLCGMLDSNSWMDLDIPPPDRLLGDFLTTDARVFLVGKTGLGKTMIGVGMAVAMATGRPFLHWTPDRVARVLYIDGEMPTGLIKRRLADAARRGGVPIPRGKLLVYGADRGEDIARRCPSLPPIPPLNTDAGHVWVQLLIEAIGGVDVVLFDNVMSLVSGDQKDEEVWTQTTPLVMWLTRQKIGQVWLDHTGHNTDRQYGSSTKAWRFDAVAVMTTIPNEKENPRELGFDLAFHKARRREPDNWQQFAQCTVRLRDDVWMTSEASTTTKPESKPTRVRANLATLLVARCGESVALADLREACLKDHAISPVESRASRRRAFDRAYQDALTLELVHQDGETVFLGLSHGLSHSEQPKFPANPPYQDDIPQ